MYWIYKHEDLCTDDRQKVAGKYWTELTHIEENEDRMRRPLLLKKIKR